MKVTKHTAIALAIVTVVIFGLAGWGAELGLDPKVLDSIQALAGVLGAAICAALRQLVTKDTDANGVPDVLEGDK